MKEFTFESFDNTEITYYVWDDVEQPKGVVQLLHGMTEHAGRYDNFAKFLNANGFIVFADDHRAHGKTAKGKYGVAEKNNFDSTVRDEIVLSGIIRKQYSLPLIVFGHSYGSFLTQRYIQCNSKNIAAAVLSGSAYMKNAIAAMGRMVTGVQAFFFDVHKKDKLLDKVVFGSYDKKFKNEKLKNTWLSRDKEVVKAYNADERCTFIQSIGFQYSFMHGFKQLYQSSNLNTIRKDLPLYVTGGNDDPLSAGKLNLLWEMYEKLGIKRVEHKVYDGARHEILNEINKEEVYTDILQFLESVV